MVGLCCCSCPCGTVGDEYEEYGLPNPSNNDPLLYRHCLCLRFFFHHLFTWSSTALGVLGNSASFQRLDGPSASSSHSPIQGATALTSSSPQTSSTETQVSVSRPFSYDAEQRYSSRSQAQRDGLVSRRDKSSITQFQQDSHSQLTSTESLGFVKKWNGADADTYVQVQPSFEDEDVCPTCLDEYTPENPKITMRCSHHFHLACIYEWLERSESCPICGKEMEFCESP